MPNPKTFNCPSCGAALPIPPDGAASVECNYCGNTVVVPRSMRTRAPQRMKATRDLFSYLRTISPQMDAQEFKLAIIAIIVFGIVALASVLNPFQSHSASSEMVQAEQTAVAITNRMSQTMNGTRTSSNTRFPQPTLTFGGTGTAPGLFQNARYVAADGDGNFYVADSKTQRIQKFDATGKYLFLWTVTDAKTNRPVSYISALSADNAGNVYVTADNSIFKYDGAAGKLVQTFSGHAYKSAHPLAEGGLYATAASQTPDDLVKLDADGKEMWYKHGIISSQPNSKAPDELRIAADGLGNIFALQPDLGEIFKYTTDGQFVTRFGSKGGQPGQFHSDGIRFIALDNQSNIYVSDFDQLYAFDATGRYLYWDETFFAGVGGAPRAMIISPQNKIVIVQDDNKLYQMELPAP